jgi:hypothetical protein
VTKRLYIITGKGGVGKTTFATSLALALKDKGHKVELALWEPNPNKEEIMKIIDRVWVFDLLESARLYLNLRLPGPFMANWIVKIKFFKTLLMGVPGMSYVIFLGHIWDKLRQEKDLIIILDSPSSGHALTMLESLKVFSQIFQKGLFFDDIKKIFNFFLDKNFVRPIVIALPTQLALTEGYELSGQLEQYFSQKTKLTLNHCYFKLFDQTDETIIPDFIKLKMENERKAVEGFHGEIEGVIPYIPENDLIHLTNQLKHHLDYLC